MSARLTLTTRRGEDGGVTLTAAGEIDLSTIGRFDDALRAAIAEAGAGGVAAVDLGGVEYLDSGAINVLFAHSARLGRVVVNPLLLEDSSSAASIR